VQIPESSNDVILESSSSLSEQIDNKNNNSDVSKINGSQPNTDNTIFKTVSENTPSQKTNDSEIIKTKIIDEKNNTDKINDKKEIKKSNNLSVEDIELGIMLNQINLGCDSSMFTDTISYYDGMGPALYRLCKFDSSLNFFNESLIKNPNNVKVLTNKGSALGKLGYFSEAITYYDQAIKIDPDFLPAKNNKANILANMEHYDDAIVLYNEILEKNPDYLTARKNLDIALSLNVDVANLVHTSPDSDIENIFYVESSMSEKTIQTNQKTQEPISLIDEISLAFSTLGSLFGFLN
jgi:tetratricopeptide (TPR) repeat protein